jgi:hypothetical protein
LAPLSSCDSIADGFQDRTIPEIALLRKDGRPPKRTLEAVSFCVLFQEAR